MKKSTIRIIALAAIAVVGLVTKGKLDLSQLGAALGADEQAAEALQGALSVAEAETEPESAAAHAAPQSPSESAQSGYISLPGLEIPLCKAASHAKDHEIRKFENYTICYRESYEQPEWSAYEFTTEELARNYGRSNDFRPDPKISTGSATLADYKGSGYSRGHLTPAGDFAFSEKAMSETFYMSNMSPQATELNGGTWQKLESQVRVWVSKFGRAYVISGPILEKPAAEYESIGKSKVAVPEYYYKVILAPVYKNAADARSPDDAKSVAAIGFIMPNRRCDGTFWDYAVSVDEIEARTGLDFFSSLDDSIESEIERTFDIATWQ